MIFARAMRPVASMIKKLLKEKVGRLITDTLGQRVSDFDISHPVEGKLGDFSTNVSFRVSKILHRLPMEIAKDLVDNVYKSELSELVEKVEVAGPGFVNFFLKKEILLQEVGKILKEGRHHSQSDVLSGQKIMIEFAHPNTHKEFHIGHLRNISLGESLVRLHEALGAKIIRANYQGDVGLHVAKALWGINRLGLIDEAKPILERIEFLGKAYVEGNRAYEEDQKEEVVEINKKIYARDPTILDLWQKTRAWSLEYFDALYAKLGTRYDRLYFESEVAQPGVKIAKKALKSNILRESEGAVIFDGEPYGLDKRVFLTKEGLPTYEAKELGLANLEFSEFGEIDRCLHVVGPEQQSFFKVTFKVEGLLDPQKYAGKQYHFVYGYVQLKEGKMSSRRGNVVTALSVLEQAKGAVREIFRLSDLRNLSSLGDLEREELAEKVAVGAVKYSLLKTDAKNDIAFDLKESVSLEGNSGPYLQYTYARAQSVLRKSQNTNNKTRANSKIQNSNPPSEVDDWNLRFVCDLDLGAWELAPEELSLLRTLYKFPEVVETAALSYSPHLLCNFLFDLAQKFNLFYNNVRILGESSVTRNSQLEADSKLNPSSQVINYELQITRFRLALTAATAQILANGLYLLGIQSPERM